jgi:hypothetical protein
MLSGACSRTHRHAYKLHHAHRGLRTELSGLVLRRLWPTDSRTNLSVCRVAAVHSHTHIHSYPDVFKCSHTHTLTHPLNPNAHARDMTRTGHYTPDFEARSCTPCAPGFVASTAASAECLPCTPSQGVAVGSGGAACVPCGEGTWL